MVVIGEFWQWLEYLIFVVIPGKYWLNAFMNHATREVSFKLPFDEKNLAMLKNQDALGALNNAII